MEGTNELLNFTIPQLLRWRVNETGDKVALQGNLDPATLRESPEVIRQGVADTLASYGKGPGHVFNLGHGITPDINPDHVTAFVDAVQELSPQYHSA